MKIVADENIDAPIVDRLRLDGHAVTAIAEAHRGAPDEEVLAIANAAGAVLLTADRDFDELVFRLHQANEGVVLVRLAGQSCEAKVKLISDFFTRHEEEILGAFSVITPDLVQIRKQS